MNLKRILFFLSFITLSAIIFNCERDDICAETTQTTPRLIIEFYDASEPEELKNVPRLTVYGEGLFTDENDVVTEPELKSDATLKYNENTNTLELPLKIKEVPIDEFITTRFVLERDTNLRVEDDDLTTNSNKDIIEIRYNSEFIYVSRACGYKSIFTNLRVISEEADSDPWITNIEIDQNIESTIQNENTTHVRIFH